MKEVKYLSHLSRNFYLYFILFFTLRLLNIISLKPNQVIVGLIVFIISYSPVYFLNDYVDKNEDKKLKRANLYLSISNKIVYWGIFFFLILSGLLLSLNLNPISPLILVTLYFLNYIYSFPPFRFRNIYFLRELLISIIYSFKWLLIISYWNLSFYYLPLPILIMASSFASMNLSLYKRHLKRNRYSEYFFGLIFIIFWFFTIGIYKKVLLLFLPLLPVVIYLWFRYKKSHIPIGFYQTLYFIYALI